MTQTTPAMTPSVRWGELTGEEIAAAAARDAMAIIPLGCTEQHAHHLPTDTDTYQVERLAVGAASEARDRHGVECLVLPTLPFGPTAEHVGFVGAIDLPSEVYVTVVKCLVRSVIESGFARIGVLTGCGGHWVVPGALWDAKADARRAGREVRIHLLRAEADMHAAQERHFPGTPRGHAAVMETAMCLAGRPDLVRRDRIVAPTLDRFVERYRDGGEIFLFDEVTDTGGLGDASAATATGGEAVWADLVAGLAGRLKLIADQHAASNSTTRTDVTRTGATQAEEG